MSTFLQRATWELVRIAKKNAPVRDAYYLHKNGKYYKTWSKYGQPGNLKNKGIVAQIGKMRSVMKIGGAAAPYAKYTPYTSRKKDWINKTKTEFIQALQAQGAKRV